MKKALFLLVIFISFGIYANAQILQKGYYNDGKVIAHIESSTSITSFGKRKKNDRLVIKNISNEELVVHYCYRSVRNDENDNFVMDKIFYEDATIKPGDEKWGTGYLTNGYIGYYYVDSFAIMNVQYENIPQGNTINSPLASSNIPLELQGTWSTGQITVMLSANQLSIVYANGNSIMGTVINVTRENNPNATTKTEYPSGWAILTTVTAVNNKGLFPINVGGKAGFKFYLNASKNKLVASDDIESIFTKQ
jgi:hypothetical protein